LSITALVRCPLSNVCKHSQKTSKKERSGCLNHSLPYDEVSCAYVGHPKIAITSPFGTRRTRRRFTRYCRITHNLNNYNGICHKGRLRPSYHLNSCCSIPSSTVAGIQFIRPRYTQLLIFTFRLNIHVCILGVRAGPDQTLCEIGMLYIWSIVQCDTESYDHMVDVTLVSVYISQ
jgi:hypothetical protein